MSESRGSNSSSLWSNSIEFVLVCLCAFVRGSADVPGMRSALHTSSCISSVARLGFLFFNYEIKMVVPIQEAFLSRFLNLNAIAAD